MAIQIFDCRVVACLWAALGLIVTTNGASAGVWRWGCSGTLGSEQIIYVGDSLLVTPTNPPRGKIQDMLFTDQLARTVDDFKNSYTFFGNDMGFSPAKRFGNLMKPNESVTLTEKSSRRVSHKHKLICGRDETNDIFRKVYSYERTGEPARDITMECAEYQLSTRSGRAPCD